MLKPAGGLTLSVQQVRFFVIGSANFHLSENLSVLLQDWGKYSPLEKYWSPLYFLKLVSLAIIIALPLGWYAMNKWLEDFSYRIEISWWVFVTAAFLAVAISILTVSYQSIKAAIVNPVNSLRSE